MGTTMLERAIAFATEKHAGQLRKGPRWIPYVVHPLDVMGRLVRIGVSDQSILSAAVLHDVMEDCGVTRADLEANFDADVASFVQEVTVPYGLSSLDGKRWQEEKAPALSYGAKLIRTADKTSNLDDLCTNPPGWAEEAVIGYAQAACRIVKASMVGPFIGNDGARLAAAYDAFFVAYFGVMHKYGE